jgi:hypothetical protein
MTKLKINPGLRRKELARLLGGKKSHHFSHSVTVKIEKLEGILEECVKPRLYYRYRPIDSINASVHLEGGPCLKSRKLSKTMKDCDEIICFIATIGDGIEKEIKRLTDENHLAGAYILDAMGSLAVESVVEKFYQRMSAKYRAEGRGVALRFSPGYCDWPITDQKKIFSLFDAFQLNVKLSESCLMQPRKSISGVFGITPFHMSPPTARYNPCSECQKRHCIARRD